MRSGRYSVANRCLNAEGDGNTELMKLCCVQLFNAGIPDDVRTIWEAKASSWDAHCSIDVQVLCGAGLEQTKAYLVGLESDNAVAALAYVLSCEEAGDFDGLAFEILVQLLDGAARGRSRLSLRRAGRRTGRKSEAGPEARQVPLNAHLTHLPARPGGHHQPLIPDPPPDRCVRFAAVAAADHATLELPGDELPSYPGRTFAGWNTPASPDALETASYGRPRSARAWAAPRLTGTPLLNLPSASMLTLRPITLDHEKSHPG